MRLFLAVAVLMLAFVAYTDAQDEDTIEQKFTKFGERVTEISKSLAERAKTAFTEAHNSEFAESTRNWFSQLVDRARTKVEEMSQ
uniref:apolipoprotein C-I n=1 Tax=Semicossyphus pulcher TaxID=241346 RepID=UPI0037E96590